MIDREVLNYLTGLDNHGRASERLSARRERLKPDLQAKAQVPGVDKTADRGGTRDLAECGAGRTSLRCGEVRCVAEIERFRPELDRETFLDSKVAEETHIQVRAFSNP